MKNISNVITVISMILFFSGCSQVYQKDILSLRNNQDEFELLELRPGYDFYFLRLDIIRQRESFSDPNGLGSTSNLAPYSRLGFHLGNGLFYDLNDNLSLLVPKIFGLEEGESFTIIEQTSPRRTNQYTRTPEQFRADYGNLFGTGESVFIEKEEDGSLILRESMLTKLRIYENEEELVLKYPLGKTRIRKEGKGYVVKQLIGKRGYLKFGSEIILDNRYFIKERANRIEIFTKKSFSDQRKLLFTMIKGKNKIIIYDRKNRGFKLEFDGDKFEYFRNNSLQVVYELDY